MRVKNQLLNASNKVQRSHDNQNAGNNRRLLTQTEDFGSEVQLQILAFLFADFRAVTNFGPGLQVLVPRKPPSVRLYHIFL